MALTAYILLYVKRTLATCVIKAVLKALEHIRQSHNSIMSQVITGVTVSEAIIGVDLRINSQGAVNMSIFVWVLSCFRCINVATMTNPDVYLIQNSISKQEFRIEKLHLKRARIIFICILFPKVIY